MLNRLAFILLLEIALIPRASAAPDGAELYQTHCAACHQVGGGGIGLPLAASKLATVPDEYIHATIRHGRVGRIMPAFPELSNAQVDAITAYIRSWSGVVAPVYPDTPVIGVAARGKAIYDVYCSSCHAADGSGEGLGTGVTYSRERKFATMPPAISNPGFLASASDQMIRQVIMLGRPGTAMQSFLDVGLKQQDIDDVVSYIRSFENRGRADTRASEAAAESPALIYASPYDYDSTIAGLKSALEGRNFRHLPERYLESGLAADGLINRRQMTLRYCNFDLLYRMMRVEPRLGVGLPCRITVVENDDGSVQLIAMNMRLISHLFNNDQLRDLADEMHEVQLEIIDEALL